MFFCESLRKESSHKQELTITFGFNCRGWGEAGEGTLKKYEVASAQSVY